METNAPSENQEVTVRRINGFKPWFVPNKNLNGLEYFFEKGLLIKVNFNPKARVMKDVFCGTDRISEADARGEFKTWNKKNFPKKATIKRRVKVGYDQVRKCFHNQDDPAEILTDVPILALRESGKAEAIWLKPAA